MRIFQSFNRGILRWHFRFGHEKVDFDRALLMHFPSGVPVKLASAKQVLDITAVGSRKSYH